MTLGDVDRLMRHWQKYPPLRDLVALFIGFEIPTDDPEPSSKYFTADDMRRLMASTGGRIPGVS